MSEETLDSWILHALRDTMEDENVRNNILKDRLSSKSNDIVYGQTINAFDDESAYISEIENLATKAKNMRKKYYLFTVSNLYDPKSYETHFQTFIYDKPNNTLYTIEPSMGLYNDSAIQYTKYIFWDVMNGVTVSNVKLTDACQRDDNDVFCQSWSLYLQLLKMEKILEGKGGSIFIQKGDDRFELLFEFYKGNMKRICKKLNENFNILIDDKNIIFGFLRDSDETGATKASIKRQTKETIDILKSYRGKICKRVEEDWDYENLL